MNDKQQLMALGEDMAEGCFAWRNIAAPNGLRRYMTDKQYQRQTAGIKKWYEPYRCANCCDAERQRRIAACLSACEGFDTAYLERAQFDSCYLPEAEHAATQRQRDALLVTLEALVKIIADTPRPDPDDVFATIDEARRVIHHCEGL